MPCHNAAAFPAGDDADIGRLLVDPYISKISINMFVFGDITFWTALLGHILPAQPGAYEYDLGRQGSFAHAGQLSQNSGPGSS